VRRAMRRVAGEGGRSEVEWDGRRQADGRWLSSITVIFIVLTSYLCEGPLQGNGTQVKFKDSAAAILITLATRTCFDVTYGDTARPWRQCHFNLDTAKAMIQFCKHNDSSSGEGNV